MKIAVFSDSHGYTKAMLACAQNEQPDMIIHLGDHALDAQVFVREFPKTPLYVVRGNCDVFSTEPEQVIIEAEGKRIIAFHGHTKGVKLGLQNALYAAREVGADILLFGHTHIPLCDERYGIRILNPGTVGQGNVRTYGVIVIHGDDIYCRTAFAEKNKQQ